MKNQFPIFKKYPDLVYLDSGATTLKPQVVIDKMDEYMSEYSANIHRGVYALSEKATEEYESVREKVKSFIDGENGEVIFTKGTTDGLNLVAFGWGEKNLNEGDEIVIGLNEHHSNLVPWQELAKRKKLVLSTELSENTKLLAICQVGNVLGQINDIEKIVKEARKINPDILVVVDGAQAVGHRKVEVEKMDVDFYAFSGHKMYGPTGVGVLWGKKNRIEEMEPITYGGGMINEVSELSSTWAKGVERFEAGTPAIAEVIGLGAAIDWLKNIKLDEREIAKYLFDELKKLEFVKNFSSGESAVASFVVDGVHAHDVATILDRDNIAVRAGHHCAMPLHKMLGVEATVRVSVGIYNTKEDVDKLIVGLIKVKNIFKA